MEQVRNSMIHGAELSNLAGFCLIDLQSRTVNYANEFFLQLLQKNFHEIIGQSFADVLESKWLPEAPLSYANPDIALPQKKFPLLIEQSTYIIATSYSIRYTADNQPVFLEVWAKVELPQDNIKDQRDEHDDRLRESEENLQAAFNAGNFGSCGIDFVSGAVTLSARSRELFGLPMEGEVTWEAILKAVDPEFHDIVNEAFTDCLEKGKSVDSTYSIKHLITSEKRWIRVVAKVHSNLHGVPLKVLGIVLDVTQEMKEDQRKNDFIAMVSHELKTPLTAVNGYMQMISRQLSSVGNPKLLDMAERAVGQIGRMSDLINGFLHMSRLEAGKIDISKASFALIDLLKNVERECRDFYPTHSFAFIIKAQLELYADQGMLEQVLNNLISNAAKYSAAGSTIDIEVDLGEANNLEIRVRDQGIGISAGDLPQIFDRFYRSSTQHKRQVSGFGIGLYLCRQIVELHGGKIFVDSEIGVGTTVSFTLPLKAEMTLSA